MIVIRPLDPFDEQALAESMNLLVKNCRYRVNAQYSDAPSYADCISAVLYIYSKAHFENIEIPIGWIGNMPGRLVDKWGFKVINTEDLQAGDLIFLKNRLSDRLVTHVAMVTINKLFFHCNAAKGGSEICSYDEIIKNYDQPFNINELMLYKDPRSKAHE